MSGFCQARTRPWGFGCCRRSMQRHRWGPPRPLNEGPPRLGVAPSPSQCHACCCSRVAAPHPAAPARRPQPRRPAGCLGCAPRAHARRRRPRARRGGRRPRGDCSVDGDPPAAANARRAHHRCGRCGRATAPPPPGARRRRTDAARTAPCRCRCRGGRCTSARAQGWPPPRATERCRRRRGGPPRSGTRRPTAGLGPKTGTDAHGGHASARTRVPAGWGPPPPPLRGNGFRWLAVGPPPPRCVVVRAARGPPRARRRGRVPPPRRRGHARSPRRARERRRWRRAAVGGADRGPTSRPVGRFGSAAGVRPNRGRRAVAGAIDARRGAPVRRPRAGAPCVVRAHEHGPAAAASPLRRGRSPPCRNVPRRGRQACR